MQMTNEQRTEIENKIRQCESSLEEFNRRVREEIAARIGAIAALRELLAEPKKEPIEPITPEPS